MLPEPAEGDGALDPGAELVASATSFAISTSLA
jgi:hypothetical protein